MDEIISMETEAKKVWGKCLKIIQDNISTESYRTWFVPIEPVKLENNVLTIQVPSQFFYEWLEEHYIDLLRKTIRKELGPEGRLEYSIVMDNSYPGNSPFTIRMPGSNRKATENPNVAMPVNINADGSAREIPNPFVIPGLKKIKINSQLIESLSFDNFIEGDCNRLARTAGWAIAENPGKTSFNPLFIYSAVGLGKTHLAHAIGLQTKVNFPDKTILYVTAEQFMHQFTEAVKNHNTNDFTNFYQMIDVLLIDDIQFLAGRQGTQDVFFHIFNHLHLKGKQIVITSDKPPVELAGIETRLLSRFKWGLAADLQPPDLETRIAILEKKVYNDGLEIPREVIEYIAYSITTNIRELEGALTSVIAQSALNKKAITLDLARKIIDKFVISTTKEVSIDYIQKVICDYFHISLEQLNSRSRKREIVQARQLAMFFSKEHTNASLAAIGMACGNKDHATVLHACRTVQNLLDTDKEFRQQFKEIEKRIRI
ncbi:MAG: chromosomal replication initiator protein [Bacteroidales bacterium]|jgi:chromosomal replication initiator protein|nr:chromosomal replication initiator protein [Bacteroidales bacterium]MDN5329850.1 chromosomal replication initiator protein [Bacteroidales bacterium]